MFPTVLPLTNFESAGGKSVLPAVLIILRVENSFFVFFWSDVLLPLLLTVAVFTTQPTVIASLQETQINPSEQTALVWSKISGNDVFSTHHLLGVVCWHVDLFAVLPDRVIGSVLAPAGFLRLQPSFIKLIHIWNWVKSGGESAAPHTNHRSNSGVRTHCCFPSCRSKGLFLQHCEQMCNSQCTDTSFQQSHACKSKKDQAWLDKIPSSNCSLKDVWVVPQIETGWVFWLGVVGLLSTFFFHGNLQAQPACLWPTFATETRHNLAKTFYKQNNSKLWMDTHWCLALAEQYFLFLSASLSWPFLQHWPQTNIIFRLGGPNLLGTVESCGWEFNLNTAQHKIPNIK